MAEVSQFQDLQEISRDLIEGEYPRYLLSLEWSGQLSPVRGEFVVAVGGSRTFVVWAIATQAVFDQFDDEFRKVLDSFKITLPLPEGDIDPGGSVDDILDVIDEKVVRIRELPPPATLSRSLLTRERFAAEEAGSIDNEDRREVDRLKGLCVIMDLCAETDDLVQQLLDLLGQGVLGFYEPDDKSLTVVTEGETLKPLEWLTYAHEYAHALQDVQFDLQGLSARADTFDAGKAVAALREGDANLTEYLFYETLPFERQALLAAALEKVIEEFSMSPEAARAPRIITETFGWEHSVGPAFVFRLYLEGGFGAIDQAYRDPPRSTEQILHPQKYLSGEAPDDILLPDLKAALGAGWREKDAGVLGELLTKIYLDTFLSEGRAIEAAAGWGGDAYTLLEDDGGRVLLAMRYSWDTTADAQEFFQAYLGFATLKSQGQWDLVETGDGLRLWVGEGISVSLETGGDDSTLIIGPDRESVEAARGELSASAS